MLAGAYRWADRNIFSLGRELRRWVVPADRGELHIATVGYPAGVYFVTFETPRGTITRTLIIP